MGVDRTPTKPVPSISEQKSEQKKKKKAEAMEEEFKTLVHQRGAVKGKLTRIKNALEDSGPQPNPNLKNVHFLQLHMKTVEHCYSEYNQFQNAIYSLSLSDERRSEQEQRYVEFEALHNDLSVRLSMLIEAARKKELVPVLQPPLPIQTISSPLPPLKAPLPTFDGTYESWFSFKCMFQTIMSRYERESPAIKLYHLRNSLVGNAAGIIDQDIINNNDYEAAWAILAERYEDKRLIEDKHIEALFALPKVTKENSTDLRKLVDSCVKNVEALKNLDLPVSGLGERMVLNMLSSKMDSATRKAWEAEQKSGDLLGYAATIEFLKKQCRILEKMEGNSGIVDSPKPVRPAVKSKTLVVTNEPKCTLCNNKHELYKCDQFKKNSVNEKYSHLRKFGLCFNCMQKGHRTTDCSSSNSCRKCSKRHHTLLHPDDKKNEDSPAKPAEVQPTSRPTDEHRARPEQPSSGSTEAGRNEQTVTLCTMAAFPKKQTLLSTAVVQVFGRSSVPFPCRALIDSCSQNHFITDRLANLLALKKCATNYIVSSLNGGSVRIRNFLRTTIKSCASNYSVELEFLVAPKITGDLPSKSFDVSHWDLPGEIELADPNFNKKGRIDMLLGAEIFWDLLKSGQIKLAEHLPSLRDTELGWVIGGALSENEPVIARTFCNVSDTEDLNSTLRRFWTIEGADNAYPQSEKDANDCIEHFLRTYQRNSEGRFIVRLPFNERKNDLGDSLEMATRRFLNLERRLEMHPELKRLYSTFIEEYEQLGHMREIELIANEAPGSSYYIPHHCVQRPESTTTQLRVVFDGSASTSTGVSINDALKVGPIVQNDLESILLNFRSFRYVFTVDVPKMFRQILVALEDALYQRILWRKDRSSALKIYELLTVTYGLASSPFLATMSLRQLAEEGQHEFPLAAAIIRRSCYIDDALSGAHTLEEAIKMCDELEQLLHSGGFEAHKWCSNASEILERYPSNLRGTNFNLDDGASPILVKTLGVAWNPKDDWYTMQVRSVTNDNLQLTRKKILSDIAKIYDPLGFVGPVITSAKLIFREVGLLNLNWDEEVPEALAKRWCNFREELGALKDLQIPRWISCDDAEVIELHGFGDSSDEAYGACLYARIVQSNGVVATKLVSSKSRILPKKSGKKKAITTPRAELLSALLLSRMASKAIAAIDLKFSSVTLWSDSTIVLSWIQKPPAILQQFVSNRVAEIQKLTKRFSWRYIPTDDNPADLISRGERPKNLINHSLWWNGPEILKNPAMTMAQPPPVPESELPEIRSACLATTNSVERLPIFDKIGDFEKLQRCMGYVVRFVNYIASRKKVLTKGQLTAHEMDQARKLIVRIVQRETFQPELLAIKEGNDAKHRLRNLHPFIDPEDDVLRVGGRIKRAFVPYDSRHQMLLPAKHPVTEALVRCQHEGNLHVGQRALLAIIRQRYWPLNVKSTIRKVVGRCITCFKVNPARTTQLMGDLPSYRVQPAPVFAHTGIDFAGPINIKSHTGIRKSMVTKGYVCLFVCMSTRAIHIEAVSSLTTDGFLAALKRFVSRRGLVSKIYSDNATNFVGAQNELEQLAKLFNDEQHAKKLNDFCASKGIDWSFIPPRSPHFGGIWEAGVKSVKHHLKRVVGSRNLTFEELTTTLVQIEAQLNSRPLTQCSDDPNDLTAITPAHFLIGREMQCIPEPSYLNLKESTLSRWQVVQAMQQQFWKRWTSEYLPELQNRQKWYKITKIRPGALVLIVEPNIPPMQWQLARILALHPGQDNITRVVTLKTMKGECKRAVTEICLLPLDEDLGELK